MTRTRYPMNPDFCEIPPRCDDCGQFCGHGGENWPVWDTLNPYDDSWFERHVTEDYRRTYTYKPTMDDDVPPRAQPDYLQTV